MAILRKIDNATSFGKAVRTARKERGLSQTELAQRCGCSQRFISELERGKPTAEIGKALSAAHAVGLSLALTTTDVGAEGRLAVDRLVAKTAQSLASTPTRPQLTDYL